MRPSPTKSGFIEPCLPSPADKPPSGANWIHEIKHDGYRLMARRDPVGIRLLTRRGNDWSNRFPLVVEAVNHLKVRSCLIDGEVVCCDERGLAVFHVLRRRQNEADAFLYAFDLLELDGTDLRREPIEVRKATLASILRKSLRAGTACASMKTWGTTAVLPSFSTPARWAWRESCPSGWDRATDQAARPTGSSSRTRRARL
jgi:ATP-dependent DNA ligase